MEERMFGSFLKKINIYQSPVALAANLHLTDQ